MKPKTEDERVKFVDNRLDRRMTPQEPRWGVTVNGLLLVKTDDKAYARFLTAELASAMESMRADTVRECCEAIEGMPEYDICTLRDTLKEAICDIREATGVKE